MVEELRSRLARFGVDGDEDSKDEHDDFMVKQKETDQAEVKKLTIETFKDVGNSIDVHTREKSVMSEIENLEKSIHQMENQVQQIEQSVQEINKPGFQSKTPGNARTDLGLSLPRKQFLVSKIKHLEDSVHKMENQVKQIKPTKKAENISKENETLLKQMFKIEPLNENIFVKTKNGLNYQPNNDNLPTDLIFDLVGKPKPTKADQMKMFQSIEESALSTTNQINQQNHGSNNPVFAEPITKAIFPINAPQSPSKVPEKIKEVKSKNPDLTIIYPVSQTPDNFHSKPVANKLVETRPVYNQPPEQTIQEYGTYQFSPSDAGVPSTSKPTSRKFQTNDKISPEPIEQTDPFEAPFMSTPDWEVYWDVTYHTWYYYHTHTGVPRPGSHLTIPCCRCFSLAETS